MCIPKLPIHGLRARNMFCTIKDLFFVEAPVLDPFQHMAAAYRDFCSYMVFKTSSGYSLPIALSPGPWLRYGPNLSFS